MKSVCLLFTLSAVSVTAFAPVTSVVSKHGATALNEFAKGYVGNEGPEPMAPIFETGSKNFDPAGFCEVRISGSSYRERESEIGDARITEFLA
jgi:hypothetical protein